MDNSDLKKLKTSSFSVSTASGNRRALFQKVREKFRSSKLKSGLKGNSHNCQEVRSAHAYATRLEDSWKQSEREKSESLVEVKRLTREIDILKRNVAEATTMKEQYLGRKELHEENTRTMKELDTCRKELQAVKNTLALHDTHVTHIKGLRAAIIKKDTTIKLLEEETKDLKDTIAEIAQDRDEWLDRAERLQDRVSHWKMTARNYEMETRPETGQLDALVEQMNTMLQDLNDVESVRLMGHHSDSQTR